MKIFSYFKKKNFQLLKNLLVNNLLWKAVGEKIRKRMFTIEVDLYIEVYILNEHFHHNHQQEAL